MTEPRIEELNEKKLIGKRIQMSFANNKTVELWRSFMPERKKISNAINADLFSVEVYEDISFFNGFHPDKLFEKWAAVEVVDFSDIPAGMDTLLLPAGLYAVFTYKGASGNAPAFYRYIFNDWLPASAYMLDNRPHFAVMGEKYKNDDPASEEEIWIPVKRK